MRKFAAFEGHPLGFEAAQRRRLWRGVYQYAQDGDTIGALLDLGHYQIAQFDIRVADVDTLEIVGADKALGLEARDLLDQELGAQPYLALRSFMRPQERGESYSSYRIVHDVWVWDGGRWRNLLDLYVANPRLLKAPLGEVRPFPESCE